MQFKSKVIIGRGVGRTLGFPTLNFEIPESFELSEGVYVCKIKAPSFACPERGRRVKRGLGEILDGVLFYGSRKTFDNAKALEVHILDEELAEAPQSATIEVLDRIRDIQKFASEEELKVQIKEDCSTARKVLKI